jgi:protein-L-isoaspartate(D-aspartate) O-methyltransferase
MIRQAAMGDSMATGHRASLRDVRTLYSRLMAASSGSDDPRLERVFELVPREAFLEPGPWQIRVNNRYVETPSADPICLYQNSLVALDAARGINNGEPFLHAAWIGAAAPKGGDVICHIGAGTGYYTALLSLLALPGGSIQAFEIDEKLASRARGNLRPFEGVAVVCGDATKLPLPAADLIYVNAGVVAPPLSWLEALRPNGRMIFPWRPTENIGLTLLVKRRGAGFEVKPLMPSWFIPCIGASSAEECTKVPGRDEARSVRSAWLPSHRKPDATAVAVYGHIWFSSAPPVVA